MKMESVLWGLIMRIFSLVRMRLMMMGFMSRIFLRRIFFVRINRKVNMLLRMRR